MHSSRKQLRTRKPMLECRSLFGSVATDASSESHTLPERIPPHATEAIIGRFIHYQQ